MVWLAKWIRENITDARVLVLTDRKELDEQIETVFLAWMRKFIALRVVKTWLLSSETRTSG